MNRLRTKFRLLRATEKGFVRRFVITLLALVGVLTTLSLAVPPAWWTTQQAVDVREGVVRDDFAVVNIGQVKTFARNAAAEMDAALPSGGAGTAIHDMIAAWEAAPGSGVIRDDFAAINAGQLKTIVKPFYDRLSLSYPWAGSSADPDDHALVNIGQVKSAFSFVIPGSDTDTDGMSNVWELAHGLDPEDENDAWDDPDGDFLFNVEEFQHGFDPHDPLTPLAALSMIQVPNPVTQELFSRGVKNDYEAAKHTMLPPGLFPGGVTDTVSGREYDDDWDGDGVGNMAEATASPPTNPRLPHDDDGDTLPSRWETAMTLDPEDANEDNDALTDGADDFDSDQLTNHQELLAGTDPKDDDSDGDGLPDGWEVRYNLNPNSATGDDGASGDPDHDEATNAQEFAAASSPANAQSTPSNPGGGTTPSANPQFTLHWEGPTVHVHWYQTTTGSEVTYRNATLRHFITPDSTSVTEENFPVYPETTLPSMQQLIAKGRYPSRALTSPSWRQSLNGALIQALYDTEKTAPPAVFRYKHWTHRPVRIVALSSTSQDSTPVPLPQGTKLTCLRVKVIGQGSGQTIEVIDTHTFTIPPNGWRSDPYPLMKNYPFTNPVDNDDTSYVDYRLSPFDIEKASLSEGQFVVNVPDVSSGAAGTLDLVFKKQGGGETIARTIQNQAPGKVVIALDEILTGATNTPAKPFDNQDAARYNKIFVRWRVGTLDVKTGDRSFDDVQINGQTKKVAAVEVLAKRKISNYFSPEWGGTWSGTVRSKGTYRAGEWPASLTNIDVAGKLLDALDPANEGLAMDGTTVIRDRYRPAQAGHPQVTALHGNATIKNEADTQGYTTGYICKPDVDQDNASSPRVTLLRPTSVAVKFRLGGGVDADRLAYDDMVYIPDIPDVHLRTVDDTGGLHGNRDQIDVWRGQGDGTLANTVRSYSRLASTCLKVIPTAMP